MHKACRPDVHSWVFREIQFPPALCCTKKKQKFNYGRRRQSETLHLPCLTNQDCVYELYFSVLTRERQSKHRVCIIRTVKRAVGCFSLPFAIRCSWVLWGNPQTTHSASVIGILVENWIFHRIITHHDWRSIDKLKTTTLQPWKWLTSQVMLSLSFTMLKDALNQKCSLSEGPLAHSQKNSSACLIELHGHLAECFLELVLQIPVICTRSLVIHFSWLNTLNHGCEKATKAIVSKDLPGMRCCHLDHV